MSKPTWGDTELNIIQDSYAPPVASAGINEIQILPDPNDLDQPASVLQQSGRGRERIPLDCWVESQAEFEALVTDLYNGEERTFTGHDEVSFKAVITSISPRRRVFDTFIEFSITFLEA